MPFCKAVFKKTCTCENLLVLNPLNIQHTYASSKWPYTDLSAPRAWYTEFTTYLTSIGFVKSKSDSSLFIFHNFGVIVYIFINVDDIIITGNIQGSVRSIITSLSQRFSVKDLGLLHYVLGIEVIPTPTGIYLSQQKYVIHLLDELHMTDCKGVPTPMTSTCTFVDSEDDFVVDISLYRRIVGKLHYLSFTRLDIEFVVSKLSQFMHNPKVSHWKAIKRLVALLEKHKHIGSSAKSQTNRPSTCLF